MFWEQLEVNSLIDVLQNAEVSLEEVLDHESILQECRIQTEELTKFLTVKSNFKKLLNYATITPSEDLEEKLRFKYPSLACEVLTSDIQEINEILLHGFQNSNDGDNEELGPFMFTFLNRLKENESDNPLTMSYCVKIVTTLLKYKNAAMEQVIERQDSIDVILKHIESNAVLSFFEELISSDTDNCDIRSKWLLDHAFLMKLVNMLGDNDTQNNAVEFLISNICRLFSSSLLTEHMREALVGMMNDKLFLDRLIDYISDTKSSVNLLYNSIKITRTLISSLNSSGSDCKECVELILSELGILHEYLKNPPMPSLYNPMPTPVGTIKPFGGVRMEIVYMIDTLVRLHNEEVNDAIVESNFIPVLLNCITFYPWNSVFHLTMLNLLTEIFATTQHGAPQKSLVMHLVQTFDIYSWYSSMVEKISSKSSHRPGYSGLIWKLGTLLDSLVATELGQEIVNSDGSLVSVWKTVCDSYLHPANKRNQVPELQIDTSIRGSELSFIEANEDDMDIGDNSPDQISEHFKGSKAVDLNEMLHEMSADLFSRGLNHHINSRPVPKAGLEGSTTMTADDSEEWPENELQMLPIPTDDQNDLPAGMRMAATDFDSEEDSSDDDDVTNGPAVIKQKNQGTAAKYLVSDVAGSPSIELKLFDAPLDGEEFVGSTDPWGASAADQSAHSGAEVNQSSVEQDWANF